MTIKEIGRLREMAFREVGEGTGKDRYLDIYDEIYDHLILWNKKDTAIAGAYRIGKTDEILRLYGRNGLYTHSLFRYKKSFSSILAIVWSLAAVLLSKSISANIFICYCFGRVLWPISGFILTIAFY